MNKHARYRRRGPSSPFTVAEQEYIRDPSLQNYDTYSHLDKWGWWAWTSFGGVMFGRDGARTPEEREKVVLACRERKVNRQ